MDIGLHRLPDQDDRLCVGKVGLTEEERAEFEFFELVLKNFLLPDNRLALFLL